MCHVNTPNERGKGITGAPRISITPAQRVVILKIDWWVSKNISKGKVEITWQFLKHEPMRILSVLGND